MKDYENQEMPNAPDLEEVVLGALMIESNAILYVIDILADDSFYNPKHQYIYDAIVFLHRGNYNKDYKIDIITVTEQLRKNGNLDFVGGPYYITQLSGKVASAIHLEYHSRIIQQKCIQRRLIKLTELIQKMAFDPGCDVDDLLNYTEREIDNVCNNSVKKSGNSLSVGEILPEVMNNIEAASLRGDGLVGLPTGFTSLDRKILGWQAPNLIIIAARPAMGKTAFVMSIARNMAINLQRTEGILMFSLEMSAVELVNRLILMESRIESEKLKTGKLEPEEWAHLERKNKAIETAPIYIDDTPSITVYELRRKAKARMKKNPIGLIIIDYLQLMAGENLNKNENREQVVSTISRNLKALCKELNVPIIALSQLNRSVEMRSGDKRPQLSDLRESGAIEQDADMVLFIHRPEKYGIIEDENGNSTRGLAEIIISKHRSGPTGIVNLFFDETVTEFSEPEIVLFPPEENTNVPKENEWNITPRQSEF